MRKITARMLREAGACEYQVVIFEERWPVGAAVTEKNAMIAVTLGLDVDWAKRLLGRVGRVVYEAAVARAWAAYRAAGASAFVQAWNSQEEVPDE